MRTHRATVRALPGLLLAAALLAPAVAGAQEKATGVQPPAPAPTKAAPPPAARGAPAPAKPAPAEVKRRDAQRACTERADYLFIRRCQQACQVDAKGKNQAKARKCVAACGKQPERGRFLDECMARAGFR